MSRGAFRVDTRGAPWLRPDGVHFTADSAIAISDSLGPTLAALAPGTDPARAVRPGLMPLLQVPRR